jgi:hypothetical protein
MALSMVEGVAALMLVLVVAVVRSPLLGYWVPALSLLKGWVLDIVRSFTS